MNEASAARPQRVDAFFATPAAREDRWRELMDMAKAWAAGTADRATDVPDLPNFSCFHDAFRRDAGTRTPEGDIRSGFYAAYDAAGCEHIRLNDNQIDQRLRDGPALVSANFVIPYPPGFPIMVPGQVLTTDAIDFMRKLDVKEIHGYNATEGLKLVKPDALAQRTGHRIANAIGGAAPPSTSDRC